MPSLTIENYAKAIYQIGTARGSQPATTGEIAARLGVLPGTVTSMLKTLQEVALVSYVPYEGVRLTEAGRKLALRILRRHRLIELFLVQTLHLAWDEVHEEAEHMEHAVTDRLVDRIDAFLGFPDTDPHGDPIPKADGTVAATAGHSLAALVPGSRFRLIRVLDQDPLFLRYLSECGLPLGAEGHLVDRQPAAGVVALEIDQGPVTLSREAAEKLLVASISPSGAR